jgi:hypothetical protein
MPYPWNALEELTHDDLNAAIAFAASQGGGSYTLPIASTVALGGVKVDGATIAISGAGVISVVGGGGGGAVSSVAGRTGAVVLTHNDLTDWTSATAAFVNAAQAAAAAPVQSVAGRTGAVVIASGDVSGLGGLATLAPAAQGAVLYSNGSAWATLAPGTAGQVLQSGGAGANPSWAAAGGGGASLALAQGALTFGAGATVNVSTGLTLTQPGLFTALNPSGLPAGLALSNGNATVTGVSNGSAAIVRGVDAVPGSAKYYFEFVPNWGSNSSSAAGIALASATASQANTGATGLAVAVSNNFGATYLWLNGAHTISLGAFGSGVIGIAVDPAAGQIWARIGSGQWNASASANPATGVGGQSYGFTGAIYPFGVIAATPGESVAFNFGGSAAYANGPPAGFASIPPASPTTTAYLSAAGQGTAPAATATTVVSPTGLSSVLVTVSSNTTVNVQPGVAGQVFRLELKQDGTGGHSIALGSSIVFGTEIPSYAPSTAPNTRDLLQLIYAGNSAWMLVAVSHGFGV